MHLVVALAAILSTLVEVKEGPESSFYLPFMGNLHVDVFNKAMGVLVKMGLCKIENHYVTFTTPTPGSKGEEFLTAIRKLEKRAA